VTGERGQPLPAVLTAQENANNGTMAQGA